MTKKWLTEPVFIGHEIYRHSSYGGWHPLRIPRVSTVIDLARALDWLPDRQYRTSPRARVAALTEWHAPDYVAAVERAEAAGAVTEEERALYALGTPSNPVYPEMFRRPATAVGGSILAGALLEGGGVVHHPAGGTHHGLPGRANGFCYFNDPVFAVLSLRAHGVRRVAYVDIDAHHPDGVEVAFGADPDVLMLSVHEEGRWPRTGGLEDRGAGQVWNLPVPRGLNDSEMAVIREELIGPVVEAFAPEAIVLQCGSDAVEEDPQSRLSLSNRAHWAIAERLLPMAPRFLALGGGGYNPWSVGRLWTGIWGVLNGQPPPDRLPDAAEAVLRGLSWQHDRRGRNPPEHWFTTLGDVPRDGSVRPEIGARIAELYRGRSGSSRARSASRSI